MKLAEILRSCGFDWDDYPTTTSTNQHYWVDAIVQELKSEGRSGGRIERLSEGVRGVCYKSYNKALQRTATPPLSLALCEKFTKSVTLFIAE